MNGVVRWVLLLFITLLHRTQAQTCSTPGILDECLFLTPGDPTTALCPDGTTCLTNLPTPICCTNAFIILPEVPTTTTTTTAAPTTTTAAPDTCFDLVNPITGVSDCARRSFLCTNANYRPIMVSQCPLTCGFCTSTTRTSCTDQVNPVTCCVGRDCNGASITKTEACTSDCASMISYCSVPSYYNLMTVQCPQTCGRCTTNITQPVAGTCADQLNPITGYSDCPQRSALCLQSRYFDLMGAQCALTCGRCTTG